MIRNVLVLLLFLVLNYSVFCLTIVVLCFYEVPVVIMVKPGTSDAMLRSKMSCDCCVLEENCFHFSKVEGINNIMSPRGRHNVVALIL